MTDKTIISAFQLCIRYLAPRARSIMEVRTHLMKKQFDEMSIEKTIDKLQKENLLNDLDFAERFVESRKQFKPKSKFALSWELKQKGVDPSIITTVLKNFNDELSAWTAVKAKLSLWIHLEEKTFKKKIMNHLKNRGFGYEVSIAAFGRALQKKQETGTESIQ